MLIVQLVGGILEEYHGMWVVVQSYHRHYNPRAGCVIHRKCSSEQIGGQDTLNLIQNEHIQMEGGSVNQTDRQWDGQTDSSQHFHETVTDVCPSTGFSFVFSWFATFTLV